MIFFCPVLFLYNKIGKGKELEFITSGEVIFSQNPFQSTL